MATGNDGGTSFKHTVFLIYINEELSDVVYCNTFQAQFKFIQMIDEDQAKLSARNPKVQKGLQIKMIHKICLLLI